MSTHRTTLHRLALPLGLPLLILLGFGGCFENSRIARNVGVDHNGGFELGSPGKPINWNVYHKGLRGKKAEMQLDREDFREGAQSLKFVVTSCGSKASGECPGVFQEVDVEPNSMYRVSYWLKNNQCRFNVNVNSIKEGAPRQGVQVLSEAGVGEEWAEYSSLCSTKDGETQIRFELNITGPGILWLDGVALQEVEGN
ncbi:MAG: hypothetical protein WC326_15870 [Candidatus Delongbacteria bacterium]